MEELSREERREHVKKQQELERRAHERKAAFRKFGFWILILGLVFGLGYWGYKGLTKPLPGQKFDDLGREHVNDISNITYNSNPPTSGTHFPVWAKKGVYDRMISDGYLVHSLEHGYIVINYNCEDPSLKSQISTKGGSASGGQISTPQDFAAAFHKMLNDKWPMINVYAEELTNGRENKEATESGKPLTKMTVFPTDTKSWITPDEEPGVEVELPESFKSNECKALVESLRPFTEEWERVVIVPRISMEHPMALTAWRRLEWLDSVDKEKIEQFIKAYHNLGPEKTME